MRKRSKGFNFVVVSRWGWLLVAKVKVEKEQVDWLCGGMRM